jgi:hypothetical protein
LQNFRPAGNSGTDFANFIYRSKWFC